MASSFEDRPACDRQVLWVVSAARGVTVRAELMRLEPGARLTIQYGEVASQRRWFLSDLAAVWCAEDIRQRLHLRGFSDTRYDRRVWRHER